MNPMVLSFSRPDPSSPSAVAGASFALARRGFDQNEVRNFLRTVAAEMARLQERVVALERELRDARSTPTLMSADMSESAMTEILGEETARIIEAAREAAHKIKERSEEAAGRILKEASEEAARIREETELECSRRRQDATSDAEAEILMAKQQGREMVNEARSYRERVLADVARRREMAREQLQDLHHSRERLVNAFERARTATDDVLRDLLEPRDGPEEFVNLAPTTGPVPVIVQADDIERLEAVRPPSSAPEFPDVDAPVPGSDGDLVDRDLVDGGVAGGRTASEVLVESVIRLSAEKALDEGDSESEFEPEPVSNVVPLFARAESRHLDVLEEEVVEEDQQDSRPQLDAGDIFERLRRATTESVARDASRQMPLPNPDADLPRTEPQHSEHKDVEVAADKSRPRMPAVERADDSCFRTRDETLVPIIVAMSRMAKRVLADEQNQVLDTLRGKPIIRDVDSLVGSRADHGGRYIAALKNLLGEASLAGARSLSKDDESELVERIETQIPEIREFVVTTLIDPLRARLERSIAQSSDSNSELSGLARLVYREWKNQYIDEHMDDVALTAFGRGAASVLNKSMRVCWKVDPNGPPCADAEDNSLGGFVRGGDEFPTGDTHAPAHAGCRCVLVPEQN